MSLKSSKYLGKEIIQMARKKRTNIQEVFSEKNNATYDKKQCYSTALYARLSVEDGGKEDGSTLENQINLLKKYIESNDEFSLYKIYVDNGVSGVSFDRPSFNEMITDMRFGKINCIVVKDLSRLGRNYLEAGNYIEQIFPYFHVRFISVMDAYDSNNDNILGQDVSMPLKNIINDSYSKDLSRKIGATFDTRRKKGEYIYKQPPYGYLIDPDEKGHLIIDKDVADNVKQIFTWRAEGVSPGSISKRLNSANIPSPYKYFYQKGITKSEWRKDNLWTRELVDHMLRRPVYIGDMVTGQIRSSLAEGIHRKSLPEKDWFVTRGTHEPLVSEELYYKVQNMIEAGIDNYRSHLNSYKNFDVENLYRGRIRCGCCGAAMRMIKIQQKKKNGSRNYVYYDCWRRLKLISPECIKTRINKNKLDMIVLEEIRSFIHNFVDAEQVYIRLSEKSNSVKNYQGIKERLGKKQARLAKLENIRSELYEDLKDGILDETEYLQMKEKYTEEMSGLEQQISDLSASMDMLVANQNVSMGIYNNIQQYLNIHEITSDLVNTFVDKITIIDKEHIQIKYKFQEEMDYVINSTFEMEKEANDEGNGIE